MSFLIHTFPGSIYVRAERQGLTLQRPLQTIGPRSMAGGIAEGAGGLANGDGG
jgi:hypothetical protein